MADIISLQVEARHETGKGAARALRKINLVPGVIYGDKKTPKLLR